MRKWFRTKLFLLLIAVLDVASCRPARHGSSTAGQLQGPDLLPALVRSLPAAGKRAGQARLGVTRGGDRRDAVVLIAPSLVRIPVQGIGRRVLEMSAAPVFNIGDGMELEIMRVGPSGTERVYQSRFDPARRSADRAWRSVSIPMRLTGDIGQGIELRLSGGPQGDLIDDWLALSNLTLSSGAAAP